MRDLGKGKGKERGEGIKGLSEGEVASCPGGLAVGMRWQWGSTWPWGREELKSLLVSNVELARLV